MVNFHNVECHYAECHFDECHYAECHFDECHYAECHFVECHYAECLAPFKYKGPLAHPFYKFDTRVTLVGGWLVLRLHQLRSITTKRASLLTPGPKITRV
jgi:hypothetical protein